MKIFRVGAEFFHADEPIDMTKPTVAFRDFEKAPNNSNSIRKDEVTGEWRRLHNEELNDLYSSPNIARVIKSRRMRWAGHVARMGEKKGCIGSWWGNRREGDHWGDLGVDGLIILGRISKRWDVGIWTGFGCSRIETGGGRL